MVKKFIGPLLGTCDVCEVPGTELIAYDESTLLKVGECCEEDLVKAHAVLETMSRRGGPSHPARPQ